LQATDPGSRRDAVGAAELRVPAGRFDAPRPWFKRLEYYDRLIAELTKLPGARSVGGTSNVPLTSEVGSGSMWRTDAPGASGRRPPTSAADQWKAAIQLVTPRYFETLAIPLLRGRAFESTDRFTEQQLTDSSDGPRPPGVAIINEAMRKRYWPNSDPLGSRLLVFDDKSFAAYRTIIGVVGDVRAQSLDSTAAPTIFLPYGQNSGQALSIVVRTDLPPRELVGAVRTRLRSFDPAITIASVRPLDDVFGGALSRPKFNMVLVGSFAALALVIAGVGVFGIVGFLVARRTQELGIRLALGAGSRNVLWLVLSEGLRPVMFGVVTGSLVAIVVARAMRALLYEIVPLDGISFGLSAVLLVVASVAAAAIPARKALGVDPLASLRSE
jgi:predicted permease